MLIVPMNNWNEQKTATEQSIEHQIKESTSSSSSLSSFALRTN